MPHIHFNVAPRYTPGSPALVDEATAVRVALQERSSIEHALEGVWGEAEQAKAKRLGLRGIVEFRIERGSRKKQGWEVVDLITGEKFFRLCTDALRLLKWRSYGDLSFWEQKLVADHAPTDLVDYKTGHYKLEVGKFDIYSTGYKVEVYRPEQLNTGVWPWLVLRPKEGEAAL